MSGSSPATNGRVAVYPGSFDPITAGHVEIVERAAKLFDRVIVAVGQHPTKPGFFTVDERVGMIRDCVSDVPNADATSFDGLVVDYCARLGAGAIVRGLRAVGDFEPEFQMGLANRDLAPDIETVFLIPSARHLYISSSLVREIAGHGGDFERYVPGPVAAALRARLRARGE